MRPRSLQIDGATRGELCTTFYGDGLLAASDSGWFGGQASFSASVKW